MFASGSDLLAFAAGVVRQQGALHPPHHPSDLRSVRALLVDPATRTKAIVQTPARSKKFTGPQNLVMSFSSAKNANDENVEEEDWFMAGTVLKCEGCIGPPSEPQDPSDPSDPSDPVVPSPYTLLTKKSGGQKRVWVAWTGLETDRGCCITDAHGNHLYSTPFWGRILIVKYTTDPARKVDYEVEESPLKFEWVSKRDFAPNTRPGPSAYIWQGAVIQSDTRLGVVCAGPGCQKRVPGGAPSRCSKCLKVYYCSVECQRRDWPEHKGMCSR